MTVISTDVVQYRVAPRGARLQPAPPLAPTLLGQAPSLMQVESKSKTPQLVSHSASLRCTSKSEVSSAMRSLPASYATQRLQTTSPSRGGDVVIVGGHSFEVSKILGRGAFGVVWEVLSNEFSGGIALKVSRPKQEAAYKLAVLECEILEELTQALATHAPASSWRVPKYLTHSASTSAGTEVKLAMSKVDGRPLDLWLYGLNETQLGEVSMQKLLDGPLPAGRRGSQSLEGAAAVASSLLAQMAPIFMTLQKIAYHRDISAHNMLVGGVVGDLDFKMIDFGLATRSGDWKQHWKSSNLTGDPRYWSPAAWMVFAHGPQYLENHPSGVCHQYKERLDHYAFGVLTLEVIFALWHGPAHEIGANDAMVEAQAAWRVYWTKAYSLFRRFHSKESQGYLKLRDELVGSEEIGEMLVQHAALSAALRAAAKSALEDDADVAMLAVAPILLSAVELIDLKGSMPWSLIQELLDIVPPPPPPLPSRNVGHRRVLSEGQAASEDWQFDFVHKVQSMPAKFSHRKMRSEPAVSSTAFMGGARSLPPSMVLRKPSDLLTDR